MRLRDDSRRDSGGATDFNANLLVHVDLFVLQAVSVFLHMDPPALNALLRWHRLGPARHARTFWPVVYDSNDLLKKIRSALWLITVIGAYLDGLWLESEAPHVPNWLARWVC